MLEAFMRRFGAPEAVAKPGGLMRSLATARQAPPPVKDQQAEVGW